MRRMVWVLLFWAFAEISSSGAGLIIVHEADFWRNPHPQPPHYTPPPIRHPRPLPPRHWAPLEMTSVQVNTDIKDQIATTKVEQEFYNPNDRQLEGTFLFPVPKGAAINRFAMEINGKKVEGELLTADKARGIYEDIVRKLKDPALLEFADRGMFKVRIFPIEPHARKEITVSYSEVLKADGGLVTYSLPLNTEKYSPKPIKSLSVKVDLHSKAALKSVYSPSHKVEVKRHGEHKATVGYETTQSPGDSDFQLIYSADEKELGLNLLTHKTDGEDGYFLLLASPGSDTKTTKVIPKDVMFVLDTSGSMAGAKLEQAKKALEFCVENLNEDDRFEILRFATEVEPLFDKLTDVSSANRSRAQKWIKDLKPLGGTAIDDALRKAIGLRPERGSRPYVIVFLTDGRPTVGATDENQIVKTATKSKTENTRIFCFGIGTDVNTHLLDKITEETKSFSQYVLPEEDIEIKMSSFFTKIKEPVLSNPELKFPDSVRVSKIYPAPLPDVFKGEQLVIVGRYSGSGDGAIRIEGDVSGDRKTFAQNVKLRSSGSDHDFIPRLWATRRVGYLLDEMRLHGDNKELKEEVTELARKYGIVTPYTAYLIMEDERGKGVATHLRSLNELDGKAVREESEFLYRQFNRDKSGAGAVGGARSSLAFKQADIANDAIITGNLDAARGSQLAAATPAPEAARSRSSPAGSVPLATVAAPSAQILQTAQQTRYLKGRAFYQNGQKWIESEVQKKQEGKRVRVKFDSAEYFALIKKEPETQTWLALGRNVEFVLGDTVYEVYE